jgi:hypothetical protein
MENDGMIAGKFCGGVLGVLLGGFLVIVDVFWEGRWLGT